MARMFYCPQCMGDLIKYRGTVLIGKSKGWKCVFCSKFYRTEDLVRAILTV
jgi:hypothetical protein